MPNNQITMASKSPMASFKLRGLLQSLGHRFQYSTNHLTPGNCHCIEVVAMLKQNHYSMHHGSRLFSSSNIHCSMRKSDINLLKNDKVKVAPTVPDYDPKHHKVDIFQWVRWLLGSIIVFFIPFWKEKWHQIQKIEGETETVIKEVEKVAEVIEKVATVAEEVSAEAAGNLSDQSQLKQAALMAEHVSKVAAHDAEMTMEFIHKVDVVKHDLDDLENMIEPLVDKIVHKDSKGK